MPKRSNKSTTQPEILKGWQQIAGFLGEPVSVIQRWAREGMPVRREGRFVSTSPDELNVWIGKESGKPVRTASETTDLTSELKRGLTYLRHEQKSPMKRSPGRATEAMDTRQRKKKTTAKAA
ncbi:MAG: hypothetical protein ACRD3Q_18050 [Terriglobales bacterium]